MNRIFETKDKHEFRPLIVEIEDKPTSPLARWLLWIVVSFIFIALLWLYIGKVDIVVSGKGKAIPSGEIKIVQPLESGIIKKILVKEGELVQKDQILMVIDPSINNSTLQAREDEQKHLQLTIQRVDALLEDSSFNSNNPTQQELYTTTKENIKNLQNLYTNTKEEENKLKTVLDIISHSEYNQIKEKRLQYEQQLSQQKNQLLSEKKDAQDKLISIKAQIQELQFKNEKQYIKAPVDGYIGKLLIHTEGGVVSPAEKLLTIIPKEAPLILKANILNQDIGFIKKDMNVSVKVDTFNFQKYGLLNAKVVHIADDAIEDENLGLVYEVYVKPERYYLEFANKTHNITSGMSITVEVKIGKRRVVNFFIYPLIRYLDEGMSVR
jgi:hemolysin D